MILETRKLSKVYQAGQEQVHALREVNFRAEAGDFIVINGPSGSGKTTFLNLISLIDEPSSGEVFLEGRSVSHLSPSKLAELRRDKIGLMFQSFNLIPVLSAFENVEYPLLLRGVPRRARQRRVLDLLAQVGLEREAKRRPDQLSGGQKQRVALARTLVNEPKLVLADEPTGNLDSKTGKTVLEIVQRLNEDHHVTFIVVTHDLSVNDYAQRVVSIRDGKLCEGHAPARAEAEHEEVRRVVAPGAAQSYA